MRAAVNADVIALLGLELLLCWHCGCVSASGGALDSSASANAPNAAKLPVAGGTSILDGLPHEAGKCRHTHAAFARVAIFTGFPVIT